MKIPDDLRAFLEIPAKRKLTLKGSGLGTVTLLPPDELRARMYTIYKRDGFSHVRFRGINIVKSCASYDPDGMMAWFSALEVYGQWDCDHHKILVFPDVTWSDIAENPAPYFNAQWYPHCVPHRYLRPRKAK